MHPFHLLMMTFPAAQRMSGMGNKGTRGVERGWVVGVAGEGCALWEGVEGVGGQGQVRLWSDSTLLLVLKRCVYVYACVCVWHSQQQNSYPLIIHFTPHTATSPLWLPQCCTTA